MTKGASRARVLAIDPTPRGFGFVILEGPHVLVDWGVKSGRATSIEREQQLLRKFNDLLSHYRPKVVILENVNTPENRRHGRVRLLVGAMENFAKWQNIAVRKISRVQVKQVFEALGSRSKYEIACAISQQLPEIVLWLPRQRRPWTSEDYRMAAFNAAAMALTYFCIRSR